MATRSRGRGVVTKGVLRYAKIKLDLDYNYVAGVKQGVSGSLDN